MARRGALLLSVLAMGVLLAGFARAAGDNTQCISDLMAAEAICVQTPRNSTICPAPCSSALTALPQACQNFAIQDGAEIAASLNVSLPI